MLKKNPILILLLILYFNGMTFGQDYNEFWGLKDTADSLFKAGNYEEATSNYMRLFQLETPKGRTDLYRYPSAQAYAMSSNLDAAFEQLYFIAEGKQHALGIYTPTREDLNADTLLFKLQKDKRWEMLLQASDERNKFIASKLDSTLMEEIEAMRDEDQKHRANFYAVRKEFGKDSKELREIDSLQAQIDVINTKKLENIVQKYGWPGIDLIGFHTSFSLFLVIQHQNVEVQLKYLPLIEDQLAKGNFIPGAYAMLKDRISMRQNFEQLYGTQSCYDFETKKYYLCPLSNPDSINERLYNLGLDSFEKSYKQMMGENWDVEKYKQNLPKYKVAYKRDLPK